MKDEVVCLTVPSSRTRTTAFFVVVLLCVAGVALPAAAGSFVAHNTPAYVKTAKNLGPEDPSKTIDVSVWLKPHNRAGLDSLARQLYDPASPNYRHFLSQSQFAKMFAPTAAEADTVRKFLAGQNLSVVRTGPNNMFVRARGTVADVQTAFHVQLNDYQVRGKVLRANAGDPYVEGDAAALVFSVSGLDSGEFEHPAMQRPTPPSAGVANSAAAGLSASNLTPSGSLFSSVCFNGPETETLSTGDIGAYPIGTFSGKHLNLQSLTTNGCAYTPPAIQTAYNLTGLYGEGFDGTGQTIAIIDWCGSTTITQDANGFSKKFGLPLLTSSNFQILYIPTISTCQSADQTEINIDVEWAHAVAPGANISLIVPPSASFEDVNEAEYTTINYGLGTVISGSYGSPESFTPASELANENLISEIGAVSGISTNFSSGDDGDFTVYGIPPTVSAPADSPWATAVGGITLSLDKNNSILWQSGWGNNETLLAEEGEIFDPPAAFGFIGGAGGGPSTCATQDSEGNCLAGFPKPSFQKSLPGHVRLLPDVSWLADPFTGVAILITVPSQVPAQVWQVWGGTSVAAPMFSGLWAIANQEAGQPLGDAAPYMYSMPSGTMYDIVPIGSKLDVTASIQESSSMTTNYNANEVMGGSAPNYFISAIWDYAFFEETPLAISFGTDCTASPGFGVTPCGTPSALKTKTGWDSVTGVGVPNGKAFADSFNPSPKAK
ncbi:MAG TPA: S53 family peptidase [Verrucomicrobiae bacterium]|nr:S53 family peptidase [Verrucomicrobiae bacterium]